MNPATMPSVAIPRSRWLQEFNHSFSFNHGKLIPLDCFEVVAGDDFTVKKAALEIIMSTPIVPIMGNIKAKVTAFYVPMRLVYQDTELFFGANKSSAGPNTNTYTIPARSLYRDGVAVGSVSHYLGKPYLTADNSKYNFGIASVLKERCYYLIWSEWYRLQQVQDPFILGTNNAFGTSNIGNIGSTILYTSSLPLNVCKQVDMFTAATLYPQYGAAVELPLGTYAPLVASPDGPVSDLHGLNEVTKFYSSTKVAQASQFLGVGADNRLVSGYDSSSGGPTGATGIKYTNLVADLSHATAAKINDIRYAFQLQKYLERANYGSRFFEVLAVHYGVTSPDSRLQRPEYLGGKTCPISIRTVLSTAGYNAGVTQEVGKPGAVSITLADLSGLFSKGFVEPGYVMLMLSTTHERSYSQGLLQEDTKFNRFEFYSPEFANLGDQEIKAKHLMLTGDASDENTFGYQGHWDEYRYRRNRTSGLLDPVVPSAMDYWTLGEKFTTRPSLSASFVEENRDDISRCLVSGASGPDYIGDAYIQYQCTRELRMYSIPGLLDHFGAL